MITELIIYTGIATFATAMPIYKYRKKLSKVALVPFLCWLIVLGYGFGMSWVLLNLFSMKSSVAGLANMLSSIIFSAWIFYLSKQH